MSLLDWGGPSPRKYFNLELLTFVMEKPETKRDDYILGEKQE